MGQVVPNLREANDMGLAVSDGGGDPFAQEIISLAVDQRMRLSSAPDSRESLVGQC